MRGRLLAARIRARSTSEAASAEALNSKRASNADGSVLEAT